jgi:hypothetical protein
VFGLPVPLDEPQVVVFRSPQHLVFNDLANADQHRRLNALGFMVIGAADGCKLFHPEFEALLLTKGSTLHLPFETYAAITHGNFRKRLTCECGQWMFRLGFVPYKREAVLVDCTRCGKPFQGWRPQRLVEID